VKVDFWIIAMTEMKKAGNAGRQKACKSISGIARKAESQNDRNEEGWEYRKAESV
jgi:hypothetical protein